MYPVSEAYQQAIASRTRDVRITGNIICKDGEQIAIEDKDVLQGSLYLSSQCISGDDIDVGSVYASELGFSLVSEDVRPLDRAVVTLKFGLFTGEGYEDIPLGVFNVSEVSRKNRTVSIKALDNLILLDISIAGTTLKGTPFELLSYCCDKAGIALANTQSDLEAMPNGAYIYTVPADSEIQTCRDLVSWIAQLLCGYAAADREGNLQIRPLSYGQTGEIASRQRYTTTVSDYAVSVSAVAMTINGEELRKEIEESGGTILRLEENPLLRGFDTDVNTVILQNMLDHLKTVSYTPFEAEFAGNPAIDAGDRLTLSDGPAGRAVSSILTHSTWRYRGKQKLKAAGKDPRLSVTAQSQKKMGSMGASITTLAEAVYYTENASVLTLSTKSNEILSFLFAAVTRSNPIFHATLNFDITNAGTIDFTYQLDNEPYRVLPKQTVTEGQHIIHLFLPLWATEGNRTHELRVFMRSDSAAGTIDRYQLQAIISGQGLSTEMSKWDGRLNLADMLPSLTAGAAIALPVFIESLTGSTQAPLGEPATDLISGYTVGAAVTIRNLTDTITWTI